MRSYPVYVYVYDLDEKDHNNTGALSISKGTMYQFGCDSDRVLSIIEIEAGKLHAGVPNTEWTVYYEVADDGLHTIRAMWSFAFSMCKAVEKFIEHFEGEISVSKENLNFEALQCATLIDISSGAKEFHTNFDLPGEE